MTSLAFALLVFLAVGSFFLFIHLVIGKFIRPAKPVTEKMTIYECGEPTVGSAWIQFDLRYYVVALLFVIFDVEVAFFFPWAVVFGTANEYAKTTDSVKQEALYKQLNPEPALLANQSNTALSPEAAKSWAWIALLDVFVFFAVLLVGFAYLWRRGDIDWVRTTASETMTGPTPAELPVKAV
jgi:NADH-quinone oxidoreductase subunit A